MASGAHVARRRFWFATRSVVMSLARRFNAGTTSNKVSLVASATIDDSTVATRRVMTQPSLRDGADDVDDVFDVDDAVVVVDEVAALLRGSRSV